MAILIDSDRCKACGLCVEACPQGVLGLGRQINSKGYFFAQAIKPMQCLGCRLCAIACPDTAITVKVQATRYQYFAE